MSSAKISLRGKVKVKAIAVLNIFYFVNIGERVGSGYPLILNATKEENYLTPEVYDKFNSSVTKLTIFIKKLPTQAEKLDIEVKKRTLEN